MSNRRLVYKLKRSDQIFVITPVSSTIQECERKLLESEGEDNIEFIMEVEADSLPKDRYFRDAWSFCAVNGAKINIDKAREVHMNRLRVIRNKKLKDLDVEVTRALEQKDDNKLAEVAAQKQALRDLPDTVNLEEIQCPVKLKSFIPDILKEDK